MLRKFFELDFPSLLKAQREFGTKNLEDDEEVNVVGRIHYDFDSHSKFLSCYIPESKHVPEICDLLTKDRTWRESLGQDIEVFGQSPGDDPSSIADMIFTGTFYIYSETNLQNYEIATLKQAAQSYGLNLRFRSQSYAQARSDAQQPVAFISHDSRDKDNIARPLATKLQEMMLPVWFDEYSLKIGDNLRESIEKGIMTCKRCILILTPNFLSNRGWTKAEFDAAFTKQVGEQQKVILPIWDGVSRQQVYEYSPFLANTFAVNWNLGIDEVCRKLTLAINSN